MQDKKNTVHCQAQKLLFRQLQRLEAIAEKTKNHKHGLIQVNRAIKEVANALWRLERSADFDGIWTTYVDD
jgi:hypothetical protein